MMMKLKYPKLFLFSTVVLFLLIWMGLKLYVEDKNAIYLAFVGPLSGSEEIVGKSMHRALEMYIDMLNEQGGINKRKLVLDVFDDQNDPTRAIEIAQEIVRQNRVLAVIGHNYSACSIQTGQIYEKNKIPAITPASTHVKVTENNDWFFRVTFDDDLQGSFLVNYAKYLMKQYTVSIISEDTAYGISLTDVFEKTAQQLNVEIKYKWSLLPDHRLKQRLNKIVKELKTKQDAGLIFLATQAPEGVKLVKALKDAGIKNMLIAPDSYAGKAFSNGFKDYPQEKLTPGYYTSGLYVSAPFILDTANRYAQRFNSTYKKEYQAELSWHAFFAIDATMVISQAIQLAGIKGKSHKLAADRQILRDILANQFNKPEMGIEGTTGLNYFDANGNASKSVLMGVYKNNHLISTFEQLQISSSPAERIELNSERQLDDGLFLIDKKYVHKTHVVYTGIQFNEISDFDPKTLTYTQDFYLWFRFQGEIEPQYIQFLNAVQPISLNQPLIHEKVGQEIYQLYRVKGRFKENIYQEPHIFLTQHPLGISFRHRSLDRNALIYVTDMLGMELNKENALFNKTKEIQKLSILDNWMVRKVDFFQASINKKFLGDPKEVKRGTPTEYSTFNAEIWIGNNAYFYHNFIPYLIPSKFILEFFIFTGIITLLLLLFSYQEKKSKSLQILWFVQAIFAFLFLIATEVFIEYWLKADLPAIQLKILVMTFDILWWVILGILLNMAVDRFLWLPLEEKAQRSVPNLVRLLITSLIFLLVALGIVGFVFEQAITSLLATSGVVAMIVGLGIQVNLANIFSGIGLSIERSFRIGDWVKIGAFEEGQVFNMNWRVTQIETRRGYILNIPNSTVSQSEIHNFSYPDDKYRLRLTIPIAPRHDPRQVEAVILKAIVNTEIALVKDFTPLVWLEDIQVVDVSEWAYYTVFFKTADYSRKYRILKEIWQSIWIHLNQAGIIPASSDISVEEEKQGETPPITPPSIQLKSDKILKLDELQKMTFKMN
jgi:branched-chain amino acid transport system substrate-binding protein